MSKVIVFSVCVVTKICMRRLEIIWTSLVIFTANLARGTGRNHFIKYNYVTVNIRDNSLSGSLDQAFSRDHVIHIKSRLSMIVRVNVVLNVDSEWRFAQGWNERYCELTVTLIPTLRPTSTLAQFTTSTTEAPLRLLHLYYNLAIQLFRKRLSEKVHTTTPKGIVGGFEIIVFHRNFERRALEAMDYVSEC